MVTGREARAAEGGAEEEGGGGVSKDQGQPLVLTKI